MRAREYSVAYDAMREFMKQGSMAQSDNDTLSSACGTFLLRLLLHLLSHEVALGIFILAAPPTPSACHSRSVGPGAKALGAPSVFHTPRLAPKHCTGTRGHQHHLPSRLPLRHRRPLRVTLRTREGHRPRELMLHALPYSCCMRTRRHQHHLPSRLPLRHRRPLRTRKGHRRRERMLHASPYPCCTQHSPSAPSAARYLLALLGLPLSHQGASAPHHTRSLAVSIQAFELHLGFVDLVAWQAGVNYNYAL